MPTGSFTAPVLVTGIPGKALTETARLLQRQGCWTGTAEPDAIDLQFHKGSSNAIIRREIIDPILEKLELNPQQPRIVTGNLNALIVNNLQARVAKVLGQLGYAGQRWMYADPHLALLCITFPAAFPEAHWVVTRQALRHTLDELERLQLTPGKSRGDWLDYCGDLLQWLHAIKAVVPKQQEIRADREGNISNQAAMVLTNSLGISAKYSFSVSLKSSSGTVSSADTGIESGGESPGGRYALRHIRHYLTDQPLEITDDIAVVGSSDQLQRSGLGPAIDSHQTIFRFNMAPVTAEFAADAGSRCSYYFLRKRMKLMLDASAPALRTHFTRQIQSSGVICYPGEFDLLRQFDRNPHQFEMSPRELNNLFRSLLGDVYEAFPLRNPPRNGINLLACLLAEDLLPTLRV